MNPVTILRVLLPFCLGAFIAYFAQNFSGLLVQDSAQSFQFRLNALGIFTSALFLAFALCQLPLGILLDHYNPSRINALFLAISAIGAYVMTSTNQPELLSIGRLLLGFGVSACIIAAYRAIHDLFPITQVPLLNSIILASGSLGSLVSGWPHLANYMIGNHWRNVFYVLIMMLFICSIALWFALPRKVQEQDQQNSQMDTIRGFTLILNNRDFWLIMPTMATLQGILLSITSLWIVPWLLQIEHFRTAQMPIMLVLVSATIVLGQLFAGWTGSFFKGEVENMTTIFLAGSTVAILALMMICFVPTVSPLLLWVCFMLFAPFCILGYPILLQKLPTAVAGKTLALLNFFIFLCAFSFQRITDIVISTFNAQSEEVLSLAFRIGFSIPAIFCVLAIIAMVIMRSKVKIFERF